MNKVGISAKTQAVFKKYQVETMEMKNTITALKNSLEGLNSRLDQREESVNLKTSH